MTLMLAICHFAWPRKMDPTKSPEKVLFPEFPKGNLTLGGVRFSGANPSGKLALDVILFHHAINSKTCIFQVMKCDRPVPGENMGTSQPSPNFEPVFNLCAITSIIWNLSASSCRLL